MEHMFLAFATFIISIRSISAASPPCYSPGGRKLPGFGVCDPRLAASVCCAERDICLSNGLCSNPSNEFYRGGCSDKSYQSGLCPSWCIADPLTAFVSVCDNVGAVAGLTLCCNAGRKPGACCTNRTEVFTLGQPFSSVLAGPATATESEPVTATSSGTRTYLLLKTVTPAQVHSVSTQDPAPTTPSTSAAPIAPPATQRNGPNIGAIVGGALAGALLGISLTAMFCLRRRRRRKIPTIRIIRDSQHELPSDDPTFRPNSKLFPAELHPEVSQSSLVPAELEITELKASSSPADLSTSDAAPGPFELHGREIDAIKVPSPPPSPPESKGGAPRTSSHYSRDAGWDAMASVDDANEPKSVRRPKMRSRPESRSGPWQDSYEKHGFF